MSFSLSYWNITDDDVDDDDDDLFRQTWISCHQNDVNKTYKTLMCVNFTMLL